MPDETAILEAATLLHQGQLIVFPTETVYGIAADPDNKEAIERIYSIKNRPKDQPLQILVENLKVAKKYGEFNVLAGELARLFWPGPLTLVVPEKKGGNIAKQVNPGRNTIGIRVPAHETALKLIRLFKNPIACTSANFSGKEGSVNAVEAAEVLGSSVPFIIDGGSCPLGQSSTVVDTTSGKLRILREGAISSEEIFNSIK